MFSYAVAYLKKQLTTHTEPHLLARSFALGVYIAFSPFPGGHAIMMLATNFFIPVHFPTLFFATSLNNPWTMVPFYSCDYAFGFWLVHQVLGWDPSWTISCKQLLGFGKICIWSFLIGGNVLGIVCAAVSYMLIYRFASTVILSSKPETDHGTSNQQERLP